MCTFGLRLDTKSFHVELVVLRQHLEVIEVTLVPAANGATRQRRLRILDHAVRIEILLRGPSHIRAGARRVVKLENGRGSSSRML